MVDDKPQEVPQGVPQDEAQVAAQDVHEDSGPPADAGRARREPPTIDLKAIEITDETPSAAADDVPPAAPPPRPPKGSSAVVSAVSGAVAAALVIGIAWFLGWPGEAAAPAAPAAPVNTAAVDELATRVAGVESRLRTPAAAPAPDTAAAARAEALEKSLAALRAELAGQRSQSEKLAAALNEVRSAPRETPPPPVDLAPINDRLAQIERANRAQSDAIAQGNAKPADDVVLRRIVAAALLDVQVRTGEPYAAALAAAKALAPAPEALKPLEAFAASGVPNNAGLSRELLTLVPRLEPAAPENTTGSGVFDRLQAGAAKLVRIERIDTAGTDRGAIVSRITAAGLRNDVAEARRELTTLAPVDRAAAQAWLDKADARDAALATSRQFAADAMAALAKPAP